MQFCKYLYPDETQDSGPLHSAFYNLFGREQAGANQLNSCPSIDTAELLKQECMCSRDAFFYGMNPDHSAAVRRLTSLMQGI